MIKDSDKKLFDIVLVWKLDRFARNRYDNYLKKNKHRIISGAGGQGICVFPSIIPHCLKGIGRALDIR